MTSCDLILAYISHTAYLVGLVTMLAQISPVHYPLWITPSILRTHPTNCFRVNLRRCKMQAQPDKESNAKRVLTNIFEGNFGQRGEFYVLIQFLLISQVVSPPSLFAAGLELPEMLKTIALLLGLFPLSIGMALAAQGSNSLGENLTPWPRPILDNQLKTDGAYALCRHPIYGGLLLASIGLSTTTTSPVRLLFTAVLFALLDRKAARCHVPKPLKPRGPRPAKFRVRARRSHQPAGRADGSRREEAWLIEKHPDYPAYAAAVPRFFPAPRALALALPTFGRRSLAAAAAVSVLAALFAFLQAPGGSAL